jgi:uncharacterized phage-associated protein
MAYSVFAVANAFIELSIRDGIKNLTNMKLQKLVYIAQGFSLGLLHKPIFDSDIQAFKWGPVVLALYEKVKHFGNQPIDKIIPLPEGMESINIDDKSCAESVLINFVWDKYKNFTAAQLSSITHQANTPWSIVWSENEYSIIPNDLIENYYSNVLKAA